MNEQIKTFNTFCPHFSAFTAPRFSVDRLNGTGSVKDFVDDGNGGCGKLGRGLARNSLACD